MKLDVKELINKYVTMWSERTVLNTTDTWVPVIVNDKLQHRVLSRNQASNFGTFAPTKSVTVGGNGTATATIDVSGYVSGYSWALLYVNNSNVALIPTNYWISGTTINAVYWNRTSSSVTGNMQIMCLRWKVDA